MRHISPVCAQNKALQRRCRQVTAPSSSNRFTPVADIGLLLSLGPRGSLVFAFLRPVGLVSPAKFSSMFEGHSRSRCTAVLN